MQGKPHDGDAGIDPRSSVVLVDDHPGFRHGLRALFEEQGDYRVVAEASCAYEAVHAAEQHRPDLILLDLQLPGVTGLVIAPILARRSPHSRIVFLSVYDDSQYIRDALEAGAAAYVTKDQEFSELLSTMAAVIAGETPIIARVAKHASHSERLPLPSGQRLDGGFVVTDDGVALEPLSAREITVLDCVVQGQRYRTCAENLYLSEATVKNNVASILSKWGLTDRFLLAISLRWVQMRASYREDSVTRDGTT